jgi:hypothetical protein
MQNSVALYDYLVEGPRMNRDEAFVRIPRPKPRRERSSNSAKPDGMHRRKNKRCAW